MANFVISFRSPLNSEPAAAEEAEWTQWFGEIGGSIGDFGHRVGRVAGLGSSEGEPQALGGYIVVKADDFDAAVAMAQGCPGLRHGRGVEVGETIESS
jgi:hypothetical protein